MTIQHAHTYIIVALFFPFLAASHARHAIPTHALCSACTRTPHRTGLIPIPHPHFLLSNGCALWHSRLPGNAALVHPPLRRRLPLSSTAAATGTGKGSILTPDLAPPRAPTPQMHRLCSDMWFCAVMS
jgi:hypothetical protein